MIIIFLLISILSYSQCDIPPSLNGSSQIVSATNGTIIINDTACKRVGQSNNYNCNNVYLEGNLIIQDGDCMWIVINGDWDNIEPYIILALEYNIEIINNQYFVTIFSQKIDIYKSENANIFNFIGNYSDTTIILECGYYYKIHKEYIRPLSCNDLIIYPNPVFNILYIKSDKITNIKIYYNSCLIKELNCTILELDITNYSKGLYIFVIDNIAYKIIFK